MKRNIIGDPFYQHVVRSFYEHFMEILIFFFIKQMEEKGTNKTSDHVQTESFLLVSAIAV